jgi:hypothetical protein
MLSLSGAQAQLDQTRVYGPEDSDVPTPAVRAPLGQQDAGALQELIDYVRAVNLGAWQGLRGTGSFANSGAANTSQDEATLTISQGDRFRLDVRTTEGIRSTRIADTYGKTMDPSGKSWGLPLATAKLGLFFFPRLLVAAFPASKTSLIDQGNVQIEGRTLHRITVAEPLIQTQQMVTTPSRLSVVDLYFDTSTHLLIKSAANIQLDSADRSRYIQVLTYQDYRKVQSGLVAFRFHQSLNGQPQWTLQLSDVNLAPDSNTSDFYF